MSNSYQDRIDSALREGLRGLAVPPVSPDFDARVLAGIQRPLPWWLVAWQLFRPGITAAACSLAITLVFVQWARASAPLPPRNSSAAPVTNVDLLQAIDVPYVHAAYLTTLIHRSRGAQDPESPDTGKLIAPGADRVAGRGNTWTPRPT